MVYGREESIQISYQNGDRGQQLQDCFRNWLDESIRTMRDETGGM